MMTKLLTILALACLLSYHAEAQRRAATSTSVNEEAEVELDEAEVERLEKEMIQDKGDLPSDAKTSISDEDIAKAVLELPTSQRSLNPYLAYETALTPIQLYCPRSSNYNCPTKFRAMRCFNHGSFGRCCVWWPRIYEAYCPCSRCAVLTSTSARCGRCTRRFRNRSFYAVCFRNNVWSLRWISRWVASSCYCRTSPFLAASDSLTSGK